MYFYISLVAFFILLVMLSYRYRSLIPDRVKALFPSLPSSITSSAHYTRLATFSEQANAGLTSESFDIEAANISMGDSRMGLDEAGTREVMEIMRRERIGFDQARLVRQNRILAANGIDPSGMPLDSKAITRL